MGDVVGLVKMVLERRMVVFRRRIVKEVVIKMGDWWEWEV